MIRQLVRPFLSFVAILSAASTSQAQLGSTVKYSWDFNALSLTPTVTGTTNVNFTVGDLNRGNAAASVTDFARTDASSYSGASVGNYYQHSMLRQEFDSSKSSFYAFSAKNSIPSSSVRLTSFKLGFRTGDTSGEAVTSLELRSSLNEYATALTSATFSPNTTWQLFTSTPEFDVLSSSSATFRVFAVGGSNSVGGMNARLSSTFSPIPEPSHMLALLGTVGFGIRAYRRRKNVAAAI